MKSSNTIYVDPKGHKPALWFCTKLLLLFASCTSLPPHPHPPPTEPLKKAASELELPRKAQPPPKEPISPGDWIHFTQSFDPQLTGKFNVEWDGFMHLPYDVTLPVQGLTEEELRTTLERTYQPYYKKPIRFEIALGERKRWVEVGGLVLHPGKILVQRDANLDQLIAAAGGIHPESAAKFAQIQSDTQTQIISLDDYFDRGDESGVPDWRGGERVTFMRESPNPPIHLLGEIRRPGDIPFKPGAGFIYYLNKGLGPTQFANLNQVELIKASGPYSTSIHFDASQGPEALSPTKFTIDQGDTLIIHPEKPGFFDRTTQILAALGGLTATLAALIIIL